MCIAIVTTEHPQYPFILLNNRDEYLHRPTADARWWAPPDSQVLGGFDLHRESHGTWLGVTRQGRVAVLTNYREEGPYAVIEGARSRGVIPNAWLKSDPKANESTEDFARRLVEHDGVRGVGGFSLLYGRVQDVVKVGKKGLAIISNRTPHAEGLIWIARGPHETHALSNAAYDNRTWPKVLDGEKAVREAVDESLKKNESREELIERLFGLLSKDTMPRQKENEDWDIYLNQLQHSIFVPTIGKDGMAGMPPNVVGDVVKHRAVDATAGVYGTKEQTVILVDRDGKMVYFERTLFDDDAKPVAKGKGDKVFEFQVEDW
ncbi:DUF833-domain-containing protein [Delitschia confertaspora ATCC 74209]|uniref:DUF833-domain-containing protein n=1 Tax=Delitschia confertaspora ATCC 74209 TaxID=1513339 RepID=A0A9P4JFB3_9PLEO|nr:DUF833-domain-containing protein [Delitschia confertaspora ATCC 74209]